MSDSRKPRIGTLAVHAGQSPDPATGARAVPIYATAAYSFESTEHAADLFALRQEGNIYSRLSNPTCDVLEKRLAALDGGTAALVFASGMAAITAAIATITHAGQNIISSSSLYGGTVTLFTHTLKKLGIETRFFNPDDPGRIDDLVDANTRCVYIEAIGNPRNDVPEFRRIAAIAHEHDLPLIVDNTVLTPVLFRPLEHGADIVVYSTTKYIGGHGAHIGGAIVEGGAFPWTSTPSKWPEFCSADPSYHGCIIAEAAPAAPFVTHARTHWLRDTGAAMSPFAAFLFLLGLETLHVRMPRHCENALTLARWLREHPAVDWVNYAGLEDHRYAEQVKRYMPDGAGAIIGFGVKGGRAGGAKFINNVKLASHLANIGDAKTLVIHPASTTHQQLTDDEQRAAGVSPEFIRLCVGIEDVEDIKEDLDQALKASQA